MLLWKRKKPTIRISYVVEIRTTEHGFLQSDLRFKSQGEAVAYGRDLLYEIPHAREFRITSAELEPNATWLGKVVLLKR